MLLRRVIGHAYEQSWTAIGSDPRIFVDVASFDIRHVRCE